MATTTGEITCGGFVFYNNFDSANLARVEQVKISDGSDNEGCDGEGRSCKSSASDDSPDYVFNVWTKHDCHGTEYQNNNRTWFYFGFKAAARGAYVKINVVNLNKQVKMFSQGMCPVYKIVPGHYHWERMREKPTYSVDEKGSEFTLSFTYHTPENPKAVTYVAFTYPFSYIDVQHCLKKIDARMAKRTPSTADDIYYHRECAIKSLEGRRMDLLTISSHHNISTEREARLKNMFPEKAEERPFKFRGKKVIFVSARVHPGETPSTFVFNGLLNLLLNREDAIAINLRRLYVFKMIPLLNPDGVARGHYRMDTRGINLNRVYLNPSLTDHPTIYAARTLVRYHHHSYDLPEEVGPEKELANVNLELGKDSVSVVGATGSLTNVIRDTTSKLLQQVTLMTLDEKCKGESKYDQVHQCAREKSETERGESKANSESAEEKTEEESPDACKKKLCSAVGVGRLSDDPAESGLFLYIDMHGHASKKGVFMYGNYFDDAEDTITCMLLPKLMSINNPNFHFTSCNFAERNMYLIDKRDGMSREGSGRVAVYKLTGLVRSYTLECNYNSGRLVNTVPARVRDGINKNPAHVFVPPKYTPGVFEEVGASLGPSILDLTNSNPNSRLPNSQYRCLRGVKSYLKMTYVNNFTASFNKPLNKSNVGASAQELPPLELIEPKIGCAADEERSNSTKSDTSLVGKTCKLRRTTSLYAAVKRIKSSKKSRQIVSRSKSTKNQSSSNAENNNPAIAVTKPSTTTAKKTPSKPIECRATSAFDVEDMRSSFSSQSRRHGQYGVKPPTKNAERGIAAEETTVVKQGSKRLKVISPKSSRIRPEAGESSKIPTVEKATGFKAPPRALFLCNKQGSKLTYGRSRKQCMKVDQTKMKRVKSNRSLIANNSSSSEIAGKAAD